MSTRWFCGAPVPDQEGNSAPRHGRAPLEAVPKSGTGHTSRWIRSPHQETTEARITDFLSVSGPSLLADVIDICSNHDITGFTPDHLRELASTGSVEVEPSKGSSFQPHALSKRLGAKTVNGIVTAYEAGESARSIAERHGVAASAVLNLLRRNQVVVKKRRVTEAEERRMAVRYEDGATVREIEAELDLSHGAVLRALHRAGVEMRPKAPRSRS